MRVAKTILLLVLASLYTRAGATTTLQAQSFNLSGQLTDPTTNAPILDSAAQIDVKILDPSEACVLYEEKQTVNTTTTQGNLSIQVGSLVGDPKRGPNDPGNPMASVYQNTAAPLVNGCGGYTPASGDIRNVRVIVTPSSTGIPTTLSPDMVMGSTPSATVAESLQGLNRTQVLQLRTVPNLTQANQENLFSTANYATLMSLLAGQYLQSSANGATMPSVSADPGTPTAGEVWYNSTSHTLNYYNGTGVQSLSGAGGGVTSITAGTGLVPGTINSTGTISVNVGTGPNQIVQLDASGAINLPGNITTAANLSSNTASTRTMSIANSSNFSTNITVSPTQVNNLTWMLPSNNGVLGSLLQTDGGGNLTWAPPAPPRNGRQTGNIFFNNGDIGIGTTNPMEQLHIYSSPGMSSTMQLQAFGGGNFLISTNGSSGQPMNGFSIYDANAAATRLAIASTGNVGIGTTFPSQPLTVQGNIQVMGTPGATGIMFPDGSMQTSGFAWQNYPGTSLTAMANTGYILTAGAMPNINLPPTCNVGDRITLVGTGQGWTLNPAGLQLIGRNGAIQTTPISPLFPADSMTLLCTQANSRWLLQESSTPENLDICVHNTTHFDYTGSPTTWAPPPGCRTLQVSLWGAGGAGGTSGATGGGGGFRWAR